MTSLPDSGNITGYIESTDRRSVKAQHGLNIRDALVQEWFNSRPVLEAEGIAGAGRFSLGDGRHGDGTLK